jgi:Transposase DDE domain
MYLRTTQRHNRDGTTVRYVQLAHNRRTGASTTAEVLVNLGREDALDLDGLRRLVGSISRYLDGTRGLDGVDTTGEQAGGLLVESARPLGASWLLDGLWRKLGVAAALGEVLDRRRFTTDVERVLFALVCGRAIAPASKLATAEWATCDVVIPGLSGMDKDQACRAMDLLVDADTDARVQQAVFFAVADLLNLEVDLLLFDTTSTYFERDRSEAGEGAFRVLGHSKDHRDDLPQVVIGLAVTREGIPVRVWCWPGNTTDMSVIGQVKDDLRGWRLGRVVWVVDRGFASDDNLRTLTRAGGQWIAGERMRDGSPDAAAALGRQGRYQTVRDNLRVKEVRVGQGDAARRFVICHNPAQAERDQAVRAEQVARVEVELERIAGLRAKASKAKAASVNPGKPAGSTRATGGKRRRRGGSDEHVKAECALREHPTLGRWVRQTPSGRLLVDRGKIKREERLDGKFLLSTSDPDLSAEDVALGYKNLLEAERCFRDLKTTLELRPIYHRLERRIRAHVLLCWLALLLVRIAERQTGRTWRQLSGELGRLHQVTLASPAGRLQHTTRLTPGQREIFAQLAVAPPPAVTALDPA